MRFYYFFFKIKICLKESQEKRATSQCGIDRETEEEILWEATAEIDSSKCLKDDDEEMNKRK